MKKTTSAFLAAVSMFALSAPAFAADAVTFGVVDMGKVMRETDAAKDVNRQLDAKYKEFQELTAKEEAGFRSAAQELVKQKDSLSRNEYDEKAKVLQEKSAREQRLIEGRKRALYVGQEEAVSKLRKEAAQIVEGIAKDKKFSAVLTEEAVMFSTPELNITAQVIAELNKSVKKIPISFQAPSADDAGAKKK
jgi:Skp family chaperone for outer membrane proteins